MRKGKENDSTNTKAEQNGFPRCYHEESPQMMADGILLSPVLHSFHHAAAQGRGMPDSAWAALRQAVRDEMPEFTEKLSAFEYKPNLVETQIIILTRLRFLLSEITVLLGISSSSLSMKRRRLLKRLFGIDGSAGTFDDMIRQL